MHYMQHNTDEKLYSDQIFQPQQLSRCHNALLRGTQRIQHSCCQVTQLMLTHPPHHALICVRPHTIGRPYQLQKADSAGSSNRGLTACNLSHLRAQHPRGLQLSAAQRVLAGNLHCWQQNIADTGSACHRAAVSHSARLRHWPS
jgi:hypothetical protein